MRQRFPDRSSTRSRSASRHAWSLAAATVALLVALPAAAAVYKWTDASGRVIYSDQPPPANVKAETIKAPPPPANPDALKELQQKDAERRQRQAQREQGEAKASQAQAEVQQKSADCARIQAQVGRLTASQDIVYRINERGERVVLDDATRNTERMQLERWLRENCSR